MAEKIRVDFIYPPIPVRSMDYQAVYANDEPDDDGRMAVGHGQTAAAAVLDLLDNHYRGVECSRDAGVL
jgi:hypothetical protein